MMTITTKEAERFARWCDTEGFKASATALRSLAAERDALRAESDRRAAIEMARECIDDKDVIGARQTLTMALGETQ
jgi:hypothetical protein